MTWRGCQNPFTVESPAWIPSSLSRVDRRRTELIDQTRFENANKLWEAGRNEGAAREFHAMAEEAD